MPTHFYTRRYKRKLLIYEKEFSFCSNARKYVEGMWRFNKRCDNVLDMAIAQENKTLSEKIIKLYKKDIDFLDRVYEDENEIRIDHITWKSRDEAQAKYDEAFGKEEQEKVEEEVEEEVQGTPKEEKKKRRR